MTHQERIANLKRISTHVWAMKESVKITKDGMNFPPSELSEAINSLAFAERKLNAAIDKMQIP